MKKLIISLIGVIFIFSFMGCSKTPKEPWLNLGYNGRTFCTNLIEYQDNGTTNKLQDEEEEIDYLKMRQYSKLQFRSSKSIDKCTLLVQKAETKEKVNEQILDSNMVNTDVPPGKYIYIFSVKWKSGYAKFIKMVEVE